MSSLVKVRNCKHQRDYDSEWDRHRGQQNVWCVPWKAWEWQWAYILPWKLDLRVQGYSGSERAGGLEEIDELQCQGNGEGSPDL